LQSHANISNVGVTIKPFVTTVFFFFLIFVIGPFFGTRIDAKRGIIFIVSLCFFFSGEWDVGRFCAKEPGVGGGGGSGLF
jgi:hypothetical protein